MKTRPISFLSLTSLAVICCVLAYSCAKIQPVEECVTGQTYGFLSGLLHGFITPISFIASLFMEDVTIYAVNNSGILYNLGFLLGSGGWGFFAGSRSRRR